MDKHTGEETRFERIIKAGAGTTFKINGKVFWQAKEEEGAIIQMSNKGFKRENGGCGFVGRFVGG